MVTLHVSDSVKKNLELESSLDYTVPAVCFWFKYVNNSAMLDANPNVVKPSADSLYFVMLDNYLTILSEIKWFCLLLRSDST